MTSMQAIHAAPLMPMLPEGGYNGTSDMPYKQSATPAVTKPFADCAKEVWFWPQLQHHSHPAVLRVATRSRTYNRWTELGLEVWPLVLLQPLGSSIGRRTALV
jgi:hypothetical protein